MIKIEIQGQDAVLATEEMLAINGLQGSYETINEVEREGVLTTIATIVGLVGGSLTIAEQLYEWKNKYQKSLNNLYFLPSKYILLLIFLIFNTLWLSSLFDKANQLK